MKFNIKNFFKYNSIEDAAKTFNINEALNKNWDKVNEMGQELSDDISKANASIGTELTNRTYADNALSQRITVEEQTRSQADTNLQNQITANKKAENVNITETTRTLYGLTADNANVDKALQKNLQGGWLNAILTGFSKTNDTGNIVATDTLLKALSRMENSKPITGSYTGNNESNRTISIGVTPKLVVITPVGGSYGHVYLKTVGSGIAIGSRGVTIRPYTCISGGFQVSTLDKGYDDSSNQPDYIYNYVAIL